MFDNKIPISLPNIRPEGSEEVQLFCLDEADTAGPLLRQGGMLCFKIARRLQQHDRTLVAAGNRS